MYIVTTLENVNALLSWQLLPRFLHERKVRTEVFSEIGIPL